MITASAITPGARTAKVREDSSPKSANDPAACSSRKIERAASTTGQEQLRVQFVLGQTILPRPDVRRLHDGSVIALLQHGDDPVEIVVDGQRVGRGEVLECDGNLAVRVTELFHARNIPCTDAGPPTPAATDKRT